MERIIPRTRFFVGALVLLSFGGSYAKIIEIGADKFLPADGNAALLKEAQDPHASKLVKLHIYLWNRFYAYVQEQLKKSTTKNFGLVSFQGTYEPLDSMEQNLVDAYLKNDLIDILKRPVEAQMAVVGPEGTPVLATEVIDEYVNGVAQYFAILEDFLVNVFSPIFQGVDDTKPEEMAKHYGELYGKIIALLLTVEPGIDPTKKDSKPIFWLAFGQQPSVSRDVVIIFSTDEHGKFSYETGKKSLKASDDECKIITEKFTSAKTREDQLRVAFDLNARCTIPEVLLQGAGMPAEIAVADPIFSIDRLVIPQGVLEQAQAHNDALTKAAQEKKSDQPIAGLINKEEVKKFFEGEAKGEKVTVSKETMRFIEEAKKEAYKALLGLVESSSFRRAFVWLMWGDAVECDAVERRLANAFKKQEKDVNELLLYYVLLITHKNASSDACASEIARWKNILIKAFPDQRARIESFGQVKGVGGRTSGSEELLAEALAKLAL